VAENPGGTGGWFAPGSVVAGYVIEEQVGAGGMAVVYRARDEVLGRLVALKVLSPVLGADAEFRARFLRESRAVAAVDEPHIVPVYRAGDADGALYIATRFVASGDLARLQREADGPLPPAQAADLIGQVAAALDAAHAAGLVHRDVKPGNILVERLPGRADRAYLSDFGLSKSIATGATGLTVAGRFMGTPDYCAPEQVTGGPVEGRADQYSLACVAFAILTGQAPYSNGDLLARLFAHVHAPVPAATAISPGLPAAVDAVLARGMAKLPAQRYGSCAEFAAALHGALLAGAPGTTPPGTALPAVGAAAGAVMGGVAAPAGAAGGAAAPAAPWPAAPVRTPPANQAPVPPAPVPPASTGYRETVAAAWQHPSLPPGAAVKAPAPARAPRHVLVAGGAAAGVLLVAGVIAGVALSGSHGRNPGQGASSSAPAAPQSATAPSLAGTTSRAAAATAAAPAATGADGSERVTAERAGTFSVPGANLRSGAFLSADGTYLAAGDGKSGVYVFSAETMTRVATVSVPAGDVADAVSFSADDKTLYVIDDTSWKIYDLDAATGKQLAVYPMPLSSSLSWSLGSHVVSAISASGTDTEYDLATGKVDATVPDPGTGKVNSIYTSVSGQYTLISVANGFAYLEDALARTLIAKFPYTTRTGSAYPQLSLDGNTVYLPGGQAGPAKLWSRPAQSYVTPADSRWPALDSGVNLSTDGRFAITSPTSASDAVDIWNIATRSHVLSVTVPGGGNEEIVSFGIGGSEILSTGGLDIAKQTYGTLYLWTVPD
jgi:serine/threonine-protein kinase